MRKRKSNPYNFDYDYEKKLYLNIGKNYGKKKRNKRVSYPSFDKYSQWKQYLIEKYSKARNEDFLHYLIRGRRRSEESYEGLKVIVIPVELAIITTAISSLNSGNTYLFFPVIGVVIFICILLAKWIEKYKRTCHFWNDCIEVLFDDSHHVNP